MNILITGGLGFIGTHLAARLVGMGIEVVALDSLSPQVHLDSESAAAGFPGQLIRGDVRDPEAVRLASSGCDLVVHLAAETGVAQSMAEPERYQQVNVQGTRVVAAQAARRGMPLLLASSRAVYGSGAFLCAGHGRRAGMPCCGAASPTPSREDDLLCPVSVYGETKVDAERVARELRPSGLCWVVVRPQNVVGPGQAPHNPYTGVLAAFAARLRKELAPQVYGTGTQTRDFVDVRDVAESLTALMLTQTGKTIDATLTVNIGSGKRTSLLELAAVAIRAGGQDMTPELVDVHRVGDIDHACADTELHGSLGLPAPLVPLEESVRGFLETAWAAPPIDPAIWETALSLGPQVRQ